MKKICFFILGVLFFQNSRSQESNFVQWGIIQAPVNQSVIQVVAEFEQAFYLLEDSTVLMSGDNCSGDKVFFEAYEKVSWISPGVVLTSDKVAHLKVSKSLTLDVPNVIKAYRDYNERFIIMKSDSSVAFINYDGSQEDLAFDNVRDISVGQGVPIILFKDGTAWFGAGEFQLEWLDNKQLPESLNNNIKSVAIADGYSGRILILRNDSTLAAIDWDDNSFEHVIVQNIPINNAVAIEGGGDGFIILKADGTCDSYGEMTLGIVSSSTIKTLTNIKQISYSDVSFLALTQDGTPIGLGTGSERTYQFTPDLSDLVDISVGVYHSLGIKSDGTVIAWGEYNDSGELDVPEGLNNVVDVGAAEGLSFAVKSDGSLVLWGYIGPSIEDSLNSLKNLTGIKKVEVSFDGSPYFLLNDGRVLSSFLTLLDSNLYDDIDFGEFQYIGLLKDGRVAYKTNFDDVQIVPDLNFIVDVAIGYGVFYALKSNGKVIQWGDEINPEISNLREVVAIDAYDGFVCLLADGSLRSFSTYRGCDDTPLEKGFTKLFSGAENQFGAFKDGAFADKVQRRLIKGSVFKDDITANCQYDEGESAYPFSVIKVLPDNYYASTDSLGYYDIPVTYNAEAYYLERVVSTQRVKKGEVNCQDTYEIDLPESQNDTCCFDFNVLQIALENKNCSVLDVAVSGSLKRRCFNSKTFISYGNSSSESTDPVTLKVTYPEYLVPKNSIPTWTSRVGNVLTYEFSSLAANKQYTILINDSVSCINESILGLSQVIKAEIEQSSECFRILNNWNREVLDVETNCENGVVHSSIVNNTEFDMQDSTEYRVSINDTLVKKGKLRLKANTETQLDVEAFGDLVRIEVDQSVGFPGDSLGIDFVEGCISSSQTFDDIVKGLALNQPLISQTFDEDKAFFTIVGSYDPNDKQAVPIGLTNAHYIPAGTAIDYTIRFQNTGTDTAFKVVLVDTLDVGLDISTFIQGASSHPYTLSVSGEGQPVLTFTFRNINLPDSNVNVLESNGFVNFKINTYSNLADETVIYNEAAIYFDFNSPVITNEVYHTIGHPRWENFSKANLVSVSNDIPVGDNHDKLFTNLMIYPNPTTGTISISGAQEGDELELKNVFGQEVFRAQLTDTAVLSLQDLSKGIYLYQLYRKGEVLDQGKVIRE